MIYNVVVAKDFIVENVALISHPYIDLYLIFRMPTLKKPSERMNKSSATIKIMYIVKMMGKQAELQDVRIVQIASDCS